MFSLRFRELLASTPGLTEELESFYVRLNAFLRVSHADDGTLLTPALTTLSEVGLPVGTVTPYAGTDTPSGWLVCDGTAYSRATYRTLFDVIGTTYGAGDSATTFNVPDLRQRFPLGQAASGTGATLGATGGAIDHTHTGPSHTHTTGAPSATVEVETGTGTTVATDTHTHTAAASGTGATSTANPPYQVVRYLILSA